ncbi:MAG TPA: ACT domain-containing protein [Thermoanaerobaculia bacterium]|nr:ACT domain-containing protein [Thermoanaerobaculia bacterium]
MNSERGEKSLDVLIRGMNPVLRGGTYVFCEIPHGTSPPVAAIAMFSEEEGVTIVLERTDAEAHRLDPMYPSAWITLTVHSDLAAVGFLAVISRALAAAGISCNVFSAIHHDHLFVPADQGERTVEILRALQLSPFPSKAIQ